MGNIDIIPGYEGQMINVVAKKDKTINGKKMLTFTWINNKWVLIS